MANNTQTFVGRVLLDDKQAKQTIALLEKQLEQVKQKKADTFNKGGDTQAFDKEINRINASLKTLRTNQEQVNKTFNNLSSASYKELSATMKAVQKQLRSGAVERNSEEWKRLQKKLKEVKSEMAAINNESKESIGVWGRLRNTLNTNWAQLLRLSLVIIRFEIPSENAPKPMPIWRNPWQTSANIQVRPMKRFTG